MNHCELSDNYCYNSLLLEIHVLWQERRIRRVGLCSED